MIKRGIIKEVAPLIGVSVYTMYQMPGITRGGFKNYPESVLEKIRKDLEP